MKNKKLLVLVLAAFSASAIGAVGAVAGCTVQHEHSYTWHSSAEGHWEECDCGDKSGEAESHVDVMNNSTNEDGKDGKCDVCDYEIKQVVSFNVGEHGTAPSAQEVSFGGKATKPEVFAEGWKVEGWYKDAEWENAFDFENDVINDNTVLYAKWVEDDTPGASVKYPFDLELNNQNLKPLGAKGYNYYKFTASTNGRYQIGLGMSANSKKCYFTTSLDENGEAYGNGQASSFKNFDLASGESIIIKIACSETLAEDATVSLIVSEATGGDALPEDAYLDGLYLASAGLSFTIDRSSNQLTLGETTCAIDYVGGAYANYLTFTANSTNYKLSHNTDDAYVLSGYGSSNVDLKYFAKPATAIDLSLFSGIYEPAGVGIDSITKFNLDEKGGGAWTQYSYSNDIENSVYNTGYNYLTINSYILMLNVEEGTVTGITVYGNNVNSPVIYTRTGDHIPTKLPLGTNGEFEGATLKIREQYGSQYWGTGYTTFSITAYDKESNTYTVKVENKTYILTFEENDTVIKLYEYEADGETLTLVDTLTKFILNFKDLPTTSTELTLEVEDFQKNFSYYKATASGWYTFTCEDTDFELYYNMDSDDPTSTFVAKKMKLVGGVATVYLDEGAIVGITTLPDDYNGGQLPVTKGVTFSVAPAEAPKGLDQSNPYEINGLGQLEDGITLASGNSLFVKVTPPAAGGYIITVSYADNWGNVSYQLLYTVNGTTVGYDNLSWSWYGGLSWDNHEYRLTVSDTSPVWVIVNGNAYSDYGNVKVTLSSDFRAGATEPTFTDSVSGNTLTKTASVSGGNYLIANTNGSDLVVTSSSAFTATVNGVAVEVTGNSLTIPAGTDIYLNVSSAVTLTLSYEKGTKGYPVDITLGEGGFTYALAADSTTYFKFTQGGTFTVSAGDSWLFVNGSPLEATMVTVEAGDILSADCGLSCNLVIGYTVPSEISKGKYSYTDGGNDVTVIIGTATVSIGGKAYSVYNISGNTVSLKAEDGSTATLVIGDTLTLDGHELTFKPVFDENQVGYYENSSYQYNLTLNADGSAKYSAMGGIDVTVTDNGDGTYSFDYFNGYASVTFSFGEDGNVVLTDTGNTRLRNASFVKKDAPVAQGATYKGSLDKGWYDVTITLNGDLTVASVIIIDGNGDTLDSASGCSVSKSGDYYTFTYSTYGDTITFTVNGDSIDIVESYYGINGTLTKQ